MSAETKTVGPSTSVPEATRPSVDGNAKPVAILVIGMAGSGKTTLIQQVDNWLHNNKRTGYIINLDPAVKTVPYNPNIDIRDTVKYKNVMKEYNLGPNGGILTSCNLFATRFDQVVKLLEKPRDPPVQFVVTDTPGQIEIFTWSASGQIITELLASSFPTVVVYVVDTPRCKAPQTFMSNMLQACSILYKTKLPMLLVFNKVDVCNHDFALEWMKDFEVYLQALDKDATYASTLSRSLALVLDEFYNDMPAVGVSGFTGEGMDAFFEAVSKRADDYYNTYVPEVAQRRKDKADKEARRQEREMAKLQQDMSTAGLSGPRQGAGSAEGHTASGGAAAAAAGNQRSEAGDGSGSCEYEVSDDEIESDEG